MSEKDISYEENVITPEEFEEIEKKEKGKKYKPVPKPVSAPKKQKETEPTNFETLLLKIEKLEGKLEATENMIKATEEKIAKNTEEIGELRSSILERDRVFNRIESDFRLIKELSEEIKRLSKVVYSLLSLPTHRTLTIVHFNRETQLLNNWYPENPFENEYYWR